MYGPDFHPAFFVEEGRAGRVVRGGDGRIFEISGGASCTFPGSADSKKFVDFYLNVLSARPKESQRNSLAIVLTAT